MLIPLKRGSKYSEMQARCFVCLRKGHIARQCNSRSRCPHCSGRHHGSICGGQKPALGDDKPKEAGGSTSTMTNLATGMNPAAVPFRTTTSTALCTSGSQAILLQTAQALFRIQLPWRNRVMCESFLIVAASVPM